jgi:phosphoribosyl 1,2-cyclic phosphodiesterase
MSLRIITIGSGSRGNSILLEADNFGLLIDSGFSRTELFKRLDCYSISPEIIKGILITHGHFDHINGARVVANTLDITTYVNKPTLEYIGDYNKKLGRKIVIFNQDYQFFIHKFKIIPFRLSHDAIGTVGFIVCYKNLRIGFAMDLGYVSNRIINILKGCDVIILECNHDIDMLKNSDRPFSLKKRIIGNFGHLSNEQCMKCLYNIIVSNTKHIILGHVSRECNNYSIVESLVTNQIQSMGCTPEINVMRQDLLIPNQIELITD